MNEIFFIAFFTHCDETRRFMFLLYFSGVRNCPPVFVTPLWLSVAQKSSRKCTTLPTSRFLPCDLARAQSKANNKFFARVKFEFQTGCINCELNGHSRICNLLAPLELYRPKESGVLWTFFIRVPHDVTECRPIVTFLGNPTRNGCRLRSTCSPSAINCSSQTDAAFWNCIWSVGLDKIENVHFVHRKSIVHIV